LRVALNPRRLSVDVGNMRRKDPGRHSRNILWRGRAVRFALVSTALVTAIAAAQMSSKPDDGAMGQTITQQKVAAGEGVPPTVRRDKPLTTDQMLAAASSYEVDMRQAVAHGDASRVSAYRSKDIIRMTCVDDKVGQMKTVLSIAEPRFRSIKATNGDELSLRSHFSTIREGWERIKQLDAEIENCMGDSLDAVAVGLINEEGSGPNASVTDPTQPPAATFVLDRPGQASPYQ
jgi:hypothetical protein